VAQIAPFRALVYNIQEGDSLNSLIAPPYDVISDEEAENFVSGNQSNVVRLILPKGENPYEQSAALLQEWISTKILKRLDVPAVFIYEQIFTHNERRYCRSGILARLRIEDPASGSIYGHECTLAAPREDRFNMVRTTKTNLSPIFCLVPDKKGLLKYLIRRYSEGQPTLKATFAGVQNIVYMVTEPKEIASLRDALLPEPCFIADGHHRYETARIYHIEREGSLEAEGPSSHILSMLVPMTDPGLVILPTHRIISSSNLRPDELLQHLAKTFVVEKFEDDTPDFEALSEKLESLRPVPAFGVYTKGQCHIAALKDESLMQGRVQGKSGEWRNLDVTVLHVLVIQDIMGIPFDAVSRDDNLVYTRDATDVRSAVDNEEAVFGFILRHTPIDKIKTVGSNRELMPPKATYFYPKLLTGLVFNMLDE